VTAPRAVGVDVGGTKILAATVTADGHVESRCEIPTPLDSPKTLLAGLERAVDAVLDERVGAIGVGIPSRIDKHRGTVVGSVNIPLVGIRLRDRMSERWQLPCVLENDGNAAAIAEWTLGAGRGTTDLAMLTLGTGVGGGLILEGRPYNGSTGAAAELGHMVVEYGGASCGGSCRGRGHLEAYCSGTAATTLAREALGESVDSHMLVRLAAEGEDTALRVLHEIGCRLGAAIGSLANLFNLERVVIGGGFGLAAWPYLVDAATSTAAREALEPGRDLVRVVPAGLGAEAGMLGAALCAQRVLANGEAVLVG
jgi:glucokinase